MRSTIFPLLLCCATMLQAAEPKKLHPITPEVIQKIEAAVPQSMKTEIDSDKKLLVYSTCGGFVHTSISTGEEMFKAIEKKYPRLKFTFEPDPNKFTLEYLKGFDVFINNNATQVSKTLSANQQTALLSFIDQGGSFVGIHSASDAGKIPEYTKMIGGEFNGHPWTANGTWDFVVMGQGDPSCDCFKSDKFSHKDEIYRHKDVSADMKVLIKLDENSEVNKSVKNKDGSPVQWSSIPVAWVKNYGKGQVFYSTFGHNPDTFWKPVMVEHFLAGIIGVLPKS